MIIWCFIAVPLLLCHLLAVDLWCCFVHAAIDVGFVFLFLFALNSFAVDFFALACVGAGKSGLNAFVASVEWSACVFAMDTLCTWCASVSHC